MVKFLGEDRAELLLRLTAMRQSWVWMMLIWHPSGKQLAIRITERSYNDVGAWRNLENNALCLSISCYGTG
jgi:hypothetical protein